MQGNIHTDTETHTDGAIGGDRAPADDGAVTHAEVIMSAVRTDHRGAKADGGKRGSARIVPLHGHMFTGKTHTCAHKRNTTWKRFSSGAALSVREAFIPL